jgi:hypothetical protein
MSRTSLPVRFSTIRDVLWAAHRATLAEAGPLLLIDEDRLAPSIELALARHLNPGAFTEVKTDGTVSQRVSDAIALGQLSGQSYGDMLGVLPLTKDVSMRPGGDHYNQWVLRFQNATADGGFQKPFARQLAGVMGELVDNVFEHSDAQLAIAAFSARTAYVEFVVADCGIGVLGSLRRNPAYADLPDAAAALKAVVFDSASRHPARSGHGEGVKQLFRTLAGRNGDLRFRSGDEALVLSSNGPLDRGRLEFTGEAPLPGLIVSVMCQLSAQDPADSA